MKVTAKKKHNEELKIYINGLAHMSLRLKGLIGFQSWIDTDEYCIEYYYECGKEIRAAYNDRAKWMKILKVIDQNIHVQ